MKKLIWLYVLLIVLLVICSGTAMAASSGTYGNLSWSLNDSGTLTISGSGAMKDNDGTFISNGTYLIPWYQNLTSIKNIVIGSNVRSIGDYAFYGCSNLQSVSMTGGSMTRIGAYAFQGCKSLASISIPNGVSSIGDYAFYGCTGLSSIAVPNGVKTIGERAFYNCSSLGSFVFPNTISTIGDYAFRGCTNLTEISFPASITKIGSSAFLNCTGLTSVIIPNTSLNDISSIGPGAFRGCSGLKDANGYVIIKNILFYYSGSNNVVIPEGVKSISDYTFDGKNALTAVSLPSSLISIGDYAFRNCSRISSLIIPENTLSIGKYAFNGCSGITSIDLPDTSISIGAMAFRGCTGIQDTNGFVVVGGVLSNYNGSGGQIVIPDGVTRIESNVFSSCKTITKVIMPNSVTNIGSNAFSSCSALTSITLSNNLVTIDASAFADCTALESISIPQSVRTIGNSAFSGCTGLTTVNLSEGIANIGGSAFNGCTNLSGMSIPSSVTGIGYQCFIGCNNLSSFSYHGQAFSLSGGYRQGTSGTTSYLMDSNGKLLIYGFGTTADYTSQTANTSHYVLPWNYDTPRVTQAIIADGVKGIGTYAFDHCSNLTSISIPNSLTRIGNYAFYYSGLTSIDIPGSVTTIENNTFDCCKSLISVTLSEGTTSIGERAFQFCTNLPTVNIPNSITSIGVGAFSLSGISSIIIPEGITSINNITFSGCSNLSEVSLPSTIVFLGYAAFEGCSSLNEIILPDALKSIYTYVFKNCSSLESIDLPDNLGSIGSNTFEGCTSLASITIPESVTYVSGAFYNCPAIRYAELDSNAAHVLSNANYSFRIPGEQYELIYNGSNLDLVSVDSNVESFTVPNGVTRILQNALANSNSLVNITLNDSVTGYLEQPFSLCETLTSITVNSTSANFSEIDGVLYNKAQTTILACPPGKAGIINIPDGVANIAYKAFSGCTEITSVSIPSSVETIGNYSFFNCSNLDNLKIPDIVNSIGNYAFAGCSNLKSVTILAKTVTIANGAFDTDTGLSFTVLANSTVIQYADQNNIPYTLYTSSADCDYTFVENSDQSLKLINYYGTDSEIIIPTQIDDKPVTRLGNSLFINNTNIVSVTVPESITQIGNDVFNGCTALETIELPESLYSIGTSAFANCSSLAEIIIPDGVNSIGSKAFNQCSAKRKANSNTSGALALSKAGYSFDEINSVLTLIHQYNGNQITGTKLVGISDKAISEITIPNSITSIGASAFKNCSAITSISIPGNVGTVGNLAFIGCSSLEQVSIPSGTSLGDSLFTSCSSLQTIDFQSGIPSLSSSTFSGCPQTASIILPGGRRVSTGGSFGACGQHAIYSLVSGELKIYGYGSIWDYPRGETGRTDRYGFWIVTGYTVSTPWHGNTINTLTIAQGITSIGLNAFEQEPGLTTISLPNSLNKISENAFYRCTALTEITIPASVTQIGTNAFSYDTNLGSITFDGDAPNISGDAFTSVTANVYYSLNQSWSGKLNNYGGTLTWYKPSATCGTDSSWIMDDISILRIRGTGTVTEASWLDYSDYITTLVVGDNITEISDNIIGTLPYLNLIIFDGNCPALSANAFSNVSATVYFPHGNETWNSEVWQNYGGTITWQPYCTRTGTSINSFSSIHYDETAPGNCVTDGFVAHWKCSACGLAFADEALTLRLSDVDLILPAPGHSLIVTEGFPATCTETGLTDDIFCEVCGEIIQTATEIPVIPHTDIITVPEVQATCTEVGFTAEHRCEVCDTLLAEITEIPMIPHTDSISVAAIEPTCSKVGYTAEHRCKVCNKLLQAAEEVEKLPHTDSISIEAMAPTCTVAGYTEEHKCSVCEEILTPSEPIPATGHTYGEPTFAWSDDGHTCTFTFDCIHEDDTMIKSVEAVGNETKAPTCTEMGDTLYTATVADGEKTYTQTTTRTDIAANGHTSVEDAAVPPTDRNTGLTAGSHCSVCNEVLVAQTVVPALWSYSDDGFTVTAYNGTDTDVTIPKGVTALSSTLFRNNTSITSIVVPDGVTSVGTYTFYGMPALTDVWLPDSIEGIVTQTFYNTNATIHANKDSQTARLLSVRNRNFTDGEWTLRYKVTSATATPTAVYLAGWSGTDEDLVLPNTIGGAPLTQIQTGAFAGKEELKSIVIPDSVTSIATDAFTGCSDDLVILSSMTAPAKTWAEDNGITWKHYPHTVVIDEAVEPSCTEPGKTEGKHCSECGEVLVAQETVPAAGHTMIATAEKPATCSEAGNSAYWKCTTCNKYFSDETGETEIEENSWIIPAAGHTMTATAANVATCTEAGNSAYWKCTVCTKYFSDALGETEIEENSWIIPANGHTMTATAAKDATCTEPGNSAYWNCTICNKYYSDALGETEIEENSWIIPAAGHTMTATAAKPATCTEPGNSAYWKCTVCSKYFSDEAGETEIEENSWIIPAEGHTLTAHVKVDATCTDPGTEAYWSCSVCKKLFGEEEAATELEAPVVIQAKGHNWNETTYAWADDNSTVTATRTCQNGDHPEIEAVAASRELVTAPTETAAGRYQIVSKAFDNPAFEIQSKTDLVIPALENMNVLKLPSFLTMIETEAFDGTAAEAIIVPDTCTNIEPKAFTNCKNLLYIRIPAGVEVPDDAFDGSPNVVIDQK